MRTTLLVLAALATTVFLVASPVMAEAYACLDDSTVAAAFHGGELGLPGLEQPVQVPSAQVGPHAVPGACVGP